MSAVNGIAPKRRRQSGQALVLFALAAVFIIGIAGLAIEGGVAEADRRFLQAVSDGAALAGAEHLNSNPTATQQRDARQAAVLYAIAGLTGGNPNPSLPAGCTGSADVPPPPDGPTHTPGSAACDPDSQHSLYFETPYAGSKDQILVRVDHVDKAALSSVIGVNTVQIASRSVAKVVAGASPFGYALYLSGNLHDQGSNADTVQGNIYVRGCINNTNNAHLLVGADPAHAQEGKIEVFDSGNVGQSFNGTGPSGGSGCNVNASTSTTASGIATGLPFDGTFAAAGHTTNFTVCGAVVPAGNFAAACPSGEPPVPDVGIPAYPQTTDPYSCSTASSRPAFAPVSGTTYAPGCYDACSATGITGTMRDGTYSFYPASACAGPNVEVVGDLTNTPIGAPIEPGFAQASNGVTIILYNGAGLCFSPCGKSSGNGTATLTAPCQVTQSPAPAGCQTTTKNNPNNGLVVYECPGSAGVAPPCATSGGGLMYAKGPKMTVNLTGLVYVPGSSCTEWANAGFHVLGQVVCADGQFQSGSSGGAADIQYGGPVLPVPVFQVELIQ
jgi:hypothetical protein